MRKRRLLALILSFCFLLGLAAFADEVVKEQPEGQKAGPLADIAGTEYERYVKALSQLNIVSGDETGLFHADKYVTRAEAVAIVIGMLGLKDAAQSSSAQDVFADVPSNSWYAGYAGIAKSLKIIGGDGNGNLRPDDYVKYEEFIKMLVCAVGRDIIAETKGGYPLGYLAVAEEQGILEGADVKPGQNITRGVAAIYTYNTLFVKLLQTTYKGKGNEFYQDKDSKTLLEDRFNVKKYSGLITANDDTALSSASGKTSDNKICLTVNDNESYIFDVGTTDAKDYLGYNVKLYVQDDKQADFKTIRFITVQNSNAVTRIKADNIIEVTADSNSAAIKYRKDDDSDKTTTSNIKGFANVIYNKKAVGAVEQLNDAQLEQFLMPKCGEVVLLDNDSDNSVDTVFVKEYKNYIVKNVYEKYNKITFEVFPNRRSEIELDETATNYKFLIYKDGKPAKLSDIKKNDIVSLMESNDANNSIRELYVSSEKIKGVINEVRTEPDNRTYIAVDGKEYVLSYDYNGKAPVIDSKCEISLNILGEVVKIDVSEDSGEEYAFLVDTDMGNGISSEAQFSIVTAKGENKIVKSKDKIRFNDQVYSAQDVCNALKGAPQLIKCKIDSDGVITHIYTAGSLAPNTRYDETRFVINISNTDEDSTSAEEVPALNFKSGTIPKIGGLYAIPSDCVIFIVSSDSMKNIKADDVRVATDMSYFVNDVYYMLKIYDVDRNMKAKAIVSYGVDTRTNRSTEGSLAWNAPAMVIDNISKVYQEDETVYKIKGLMNGAEVTELVSDKPVDNRTEEVNLSRLVTLKRGSVIQYKKDVDNRIDEYRILYNPKPSGDFILEDGVTSPGQKQWSPGSEINKIELTGIIGTVDALDDDVIVITTDGGREASTNSLRTLAMDNNKIVYVYDEDRDKVYIGSKADIVAGYGSLSGGTTVFARIYKDDLQELLVIKHEN